MDFRYLLLTSVLFFTLEDTEGNPGPCHKVDKCKECQELKVENGNVNNWIENGKIHRQANFRCNSGFTLDGNKVLNCLQNGYWDGDAPNCYKKRNTEEIKDPDSDSDEDTTTVLQRASDGSDSLQAISIVVPIVICLLVAVVIISIFVWRCIRKRSETNVITENNHQGPSARTSTYQGHTTERQSYTLTSEYAEIPPESVLSEGASEYEFETIDTEPFDKTDKLKYDHIKQTSIQFVDKSYSHITENKTGKLFITNNTYARSETAYGQNVLEDKSGGCDDSYNRLHQMPTLDAIQKEKVKNRSKPDENDPEYHHAAAGGRDPEQKTTDYSMLSSSWQTSQARKAEHEYNSTINSSNVSNSEILESDQNVAGCCGYEEAGGNTNNYFILEPEERFT